MNPRDPAQGALLDPVAAQLAAGARVWRAGTDHPCAMTDSHHDLFKFFIWNSFFIVSGY
jgi:hypothetical protein